MKNIWKVFQFDKYDVLVTKTVSSRENQPQIEFSICLELGNIAHVAIGFDNEEDVHKTFENQTNETVAIFVKYIIDSLGGEGIWANGGPDEVEIRSNKGIILKT